MNQQIDIADLIKPKFEPGQMVFIITRDDHKKVRKILRARIEMVDFTVKFIGRGRNTSLVYYTNNSSIPVFESDIVASLDDLDESDRNPQV